MKYTVLLLSILSTPSLFSSSPQDTEFHDLSRREHSPTPQSRQNKTLWESLKKKLRLRTGSAAISQNKYREEK